MPASGRDANYREIVTKAVCGKGRKFSETTHTVTPGEKPSSILGCWIINHKYTSEKKGDAVEINGHFDVNLWYSYSGNTKTDVATETVHYTEAVPLVMQDSDILSEDVEVIARPLQQPNTMEALIASDGNDVDVQVEKEFIVEVIGETKICVQIDPNADPDDEMWEEEIADEEFEDLDPEFLTDEQD